MHLNTWTLIFCSGFLLLMALYTGCTYYSHRWYGKALRIFGCPTKIPWIRPGIISQKDSSKIDWLCNARNFLKLLILGFIIYGLFIRFWFVLCLSIVAIIVNLIVNNWIDEYFKAK